MRGTGPEADAAPGRGLDTSFDAGLDLDRLRAETPGCAHRIHLNNAGAALMPAPVLAAVEGHLALEARIGGYEAAAERRDEIAAVYAAIAELLGTEPRSIALVENATAAFALALSAVPFERGDTLLTSRSDYASNQIMYLSLGRRLGVEVLRAPDTAGGGIDLDAFAELLARRRPRLVALSHVPTHSGLVQPAAEVGRLCRNAGVPYLLDACQSVGQMPVDVAALGCDFLAATSRKFLRGPRGAGLLYVSDRVLERGWEPLFPDLRGADWDRPGGYTSQPTARRFENWEFSYALLLGLGAAARYALGVGLGRIADRSAALAALTRRRLARIPGIRPADRGRDLCAVATFELEDRDPDVVQRELERRRINVSVSELSRATRELEDRRAAKLLRVSPHYYNLEDEIESLAAALEELRG